MVDGNLRYVKVGVVNARIIRIRICKNSSERKVLNLIRIAGHATLTQNYTEEEAVKIKVISDLGNALYIIYVSDAFILPLQNVDWLDKVWLFFFTKAVDKKCIEIYLQFTYITI